MSSYGFSENMIGANIRLAVDVLRMPTDYPCKNHKIAKQHLREHIQYFIGILTNINNNVDDRENALHWLGTIAGYSAQCRDLVLAGAMKPLLAISEKESEKSIIRMAYWTLFQLLYRRLPLRVFQPLLPILAELLLSSDEEVLTHACWTLTNLSCSTENTQALIEAGIFLQLIKLLSQLFTSGTIKRCWLLSQYYSGRRRLPNANATSHC